MKQLYSYFEGLLNNSNKTLTTTAIAIGGYIEKEIEPDCPKDSNLTYSFSNKTLTLTNNSKHSYVRIYDYDVDTFIKEYNVEKLILNGNWEIKLVSYQEWKHSIKIECDKIVKITGSTATSRDYIHNLNLKSNIVDYSTDLGLYKPNIKTQVLIMKGLLSPLLKDLSINTIIFRDLFSVSLSKIIDEIQIPIKYNSDSNSIQRSVTKSRARIEKIKDIDPEKVFWIREYHVKNIIVENKPGSGKNDILLFTKDPKSYKLKYPEMYEMANGWYAIWVKDLKQFGL